MTYNQIRFIKRLLAVVLVCFGAVVAHQLFQGLDKRQGSLDAPLPVPGEPDDPLARQVELTRLDPEGETAFTLRAAESIGHAEESPTFRDVEIRFKGGRERIPLVITADTCHYDADTSAAHLEGNVIIRDENSMRIETTVLDYQRQPERIWTDEPVRFFRSGLEGEAGSLVYQVPDAAYVLGDTVIMRLPREGGPPVDISSRSANISRGEKIVRFVDNVELEQGSRWLRSNDLLLYLREDEERIDHIEAYEKVELFMRTVNGDDDSEPTGTRIVEAAGTKRLLTDKLEVYLREDGETPERMRALDGATLVVESLARPGPTVVRRLEGNLLAFDFDQEGRLTELRGRGGIALTIEPEDAPSGGAKRITARQLEASFDPETGELRQARCVGAVQFSQGDLEATAELGVYDTRPEAVTLSESPRMWNRAGSLAAEVIEIDVVTGDLEASRHVHVTLEKDPSQAGKRLFPASDDEPVHFVAEHLSYRESEDLAIYTGSARAFQQDDRIEAERLELCQRRGELEGEGSVRTVFLQKTKESEPPGRTETRAQRFSYRAEESVLRYRGDVTMRGDKMTLKAGRVDVALEEDGNEVTEVEAEGGVEIEAAEGRVVGDLAKYLPKNDQLRVSGDKAQLQNGDKLTEGKELTFFLSDDKIFVDGRELSRTKTIYTSRPRPR